MKFYIDSKNIGLAIGESFGEAVGKFDGSISGIAEIPNAYEEGKKAGLSAEDTKAVIVSSLEETEKLEVLIASVRLTDFNTIGGDKEGDYDYAALYMSNAQAIFTIDLKEAECEFKDGEIQITLPLPKGDLVNGNPIEKAFYLKHFYTGSAEDGYEAYVNSYNKIKSVSIEEINNYEVLIEQAKEYGKEQVYQMAEHLRDNNFKIDVKYDGEEA